LIPVAKSCCATRVRALIGLRNSVVSDVINGPHNVRLGSRSCSCVRWISLYSARAWRRGHMSLKMPELDARLLARRDEVVAALRAIVPGEGVIASERAMRPYESDGLTAYRQLPMVVVLPETTEQVARVLRYCHEQGIKVVPRGAGTSLSGGALPLGDGVLLGMGKFNRIREVDF